MKIKENAKCIETDDFWYDLFDGGYIKPEKLLEKDDAIEVLKAIKILLKFQETLEDNNLLGIY